MRLAKNLKWQTRLKLCFFYKTSSKGKQEFIERFHTIMYNFFIGEDYPNYRLNLNQIINIYQDKVLDNPLECIIKVEGRYPYKATTLLEFVLFNYLKVCNERIKKIGNEGGKGHNPPLISEYIEYLESIANRLNNIDSSGRCSNTARIFRTNMILFAKTYGLPIKDI